MTTSRDECFGSDHAEAQFEAILERVLRTYHQNERHGGANCVGESILDAELVPVAREAFLDADDMPPDHEVLQVLDGSMHLLGEGYHVMALGEPANRFVVKFAKHGEGIPPLAPSREQPRREDWAHDHGIQPEGRRHPAIWQHIHSFEAYGPLAVPSRVYLAESGYALLNDDQQRALKRFRSIGIVRSLGSVLRTLRVHYPDDFPNEKRASDGVVASVLMVQPHVTPVAVAIEREIRAGNLGAARDLEARYTQFIHDLWRYGVSHLDFSILNVGITGSGEAERFKIFDPCACCALRTENPHSKSSAASVLTNGASTRNILSRGLQVWSRNLNDMPPALTLGNSFSNRTSKVDSTITLTYDRVSAFFLQASSPSSCSGVLEAAAHEEKTEETKGRKTKSKIGPSGPRSIQGRRHWQPAIP